MKRRALVTSLLATPALVRQAEASQDNERRIEYSRFSFFDDGEARRPEWLVLGTGRNPVGWDLKPEVEERPAETLNIGRRLGGLFRGSVSERLRGGRTIGAVHWYGGNLIVPYDITLRRAAIAHQRTEWAYTRRPRNLLFNVPLVSAMFSGRGVGSAHISGDGVELIILITPTVVRVP